MQPIKEWQKLANGVWNVELGDLEHEVLYTDLAAASPNTSRLNELSDRPMTEALKGASFRVSSDGKVAVRIPTEPGEKIFGFGLQFDNTMKTGQVIELKVDHFERGGGATHAPTPFYISSKGYGVFFNTARYLKLYVQIGNRWDSKHNPQEVDRNPPEDEPQPGPWLAQPPGDAVEAYVNGKGLQLVAFTGDDLQDIVARYNLYSGGGAMPPLWGLGFWHRVPAKFTADQTEKEVADFEKYDIPLDVIGLEPGWQTKSYPCTFEWQRKRFPEPAAFTKRLLDKGIRLNLWENPYVSQHAKIYDQMLPLSGSHMVWLGIVPDYYMPEARKILVDQHAKDHVDIGISGYKMDEVDGYDRWLWHDHATFPSGVHGEAMRQTYGMLLQNLVYEDLFRPRNRRTYSLVRASNGAASAYPFVIYSDSYGHDEYITGLSSASLSGVLWCPEIRDADSEREWINRMHTVCLSPMAMLNAWASGTKPWSYPEATDAIRRTIRLRMRLLPYLYTAFADYHQNGVPPIRSMLLEGETKSQKRSQVRELDGETDPYADGFHEVVSEDNSLFMFGPDILAAPFTSKEISREVQLPKGKWRNFYTGELLGGEKTITVTAEQTNDMPPLYVRDGALIPMLAESVNQTADIQGAPLEIRLYGTRDASCTLYEDDGTSYDFEKGAFNQIGLQAEKQSDGHFELKVKAIHEGCDRLYGQASLTIMSEKKE